MIFLRTKPYRGPGRAELPRSPQWKITAIRHLQQHPTCAACGSTRNLHVHHVVPVWLRPDLELEPSNLITLCTSYDYGVNCHLFFGHLGNWSRSNSHVREDAALWNPRLTVTIYNLTTTNP